MLYYCDSPLVLIVTQGGMVGDQHSGGIQPGTAAVSTVSTQLTRPQAENRPTVRIAGPFTDHSPGYYLQARGSQVGKDVFEGYHI